MKRNITPSLQCITLLYRKRCYTGFFSCCLVFLCCFFSMQQVGYAQPTVLGTDIVAGPPAYVTYNLNTVGGFKQYRIQALNNATTGTIKWEFWTGTAASPNYGGDVWRPYSAGLTLAGYNIHIPPVGGTASALYNSGSGGQGGLLPAVTANNYYTFNISNNGAANNNMAVLETSYNPETITTVTRTPTTVGAVVSPTITVVMSSAPVSNVYVRYSTNGFATSTIVQLSFVGATGTASIPVQAAGATVSYYVYSSTRTKAAIDADVATYGQGVHDMATLNLNNNSGANYSYTVLPVSVAATNAANDAAYATLKAAFDAINAGTHTGVINVTIGGNTNEGALSAVLNASGAPSFYTSVTVRPSGIRSVTGNPAAPLIDLNGADNVTIDGLNDGTNTLTITNTSIAAAGTSTIRMYNGATVNTVQNCNIEGSTTSTSDGIVTLGTGINTNIAISNNNIRPTGGNLPVYGVYSSGINTAVTVSTNNIQDYYSASIDAAGIYANTASNAWTVSNNRLFQTASRTISGIGTKARAIWIAFGGGHTISGNIIGYVNSAGTGVTTYVATQAANQVIPIQLDGNATTSAIQGNIISNITLTSASALTSATPAGVFTGIYVSAGAANIGTTTGNVIGAVTGTSSINITCSATSALLFVSGIYVASATPNNVSISNNNVGGINLTSFTAAVQYQFYGIYVPATATASYTISDNIIGSTSTANSVNVGISSTNTTNLVGIAVGNTGTASVSGNTIRNCTVSGTGLSSFGGISVAASIGVLSITNNNVIACSHAGTGAFVAISNGSAATTLNISGNTIRSNTITAGTGSFTGILNAGAVTSSININSNQLGNTNGGLVVFTVASSANVVGITNNAGTSSAALTIQSNDIRGIVNNVQGTGSHTYINNTAATFSQNISANTFTNITANISSPGGNVTFISNSVTLPASGSKTINDNTVVTGFTKTGSGSGNMYFYFDAGSSPAGTTVTNDGNNFSNITITGGPTLQGWFNADGSGTAPTKNITNNTFNNINANTFAIFPMQVTNGTGNINGNTIANCLAPNSITGLNVTNGSFSIYSNNINNLSSSAPSISVIGINISGGTTHNIYNQTIHTLSSSAISTTVAGIVVSNGTTVNIYKNKVYGLAMSAATTSGGVYGISITGGTTVSVYNNLIGAFEALNANFDDAIRGISATGGTTVRVYYNTVYLNASSLGANFGASTMYASNTPSLDMRNNIFYNTSTPGASGRIAAYRRSSTTLTNYANSSDNNLFYAGSAVSPRLIFYDGTNSDATLTAYQTRVGIPRDTSSVTAALTFVSTTGSNIQFLHLNTTSVAESGAEPLTGFTDDYDSEVRQGNIGYSGTGTRPDIGADEFESVVCPATPTITGISSASPYYAGDVITISGSNLNGITYATIGGIAATIGATTPTSANLTVPVTLTDSTALIQVAYTSSCAFSNTFSFVFSGFITKGGGAGTGNWNTALIWRNNALPVNNAPVVINTGDNVTLNVSADPIKFTILSTGSFTHQNNSLVFGNTFLNNTIVNGTLTVDNAATPILLSTGRFISPKLIVNSGGTFTNNSGIATAVNIANFYVYAGGNYNHNAVGSTGVGVVNDFPGSASREFGITSNVFVTKWANNGSGPINLPAIASPGWGNLTIDVASTNGSWNQQSQLTNVQGNLTIIQTGGGANEFRLAGNTGSITLTIGGNLTLSGGVLKASSGSASVTINVGNSMSIAASATYIPTTTSGTTVTTSISAGMVTGGTVVSPGSGQTHVYSMSTLTVSGGTFGMSSNNSSSFTLISGSILISGAGAMLSTSSGNITINCTGNFNSTSTAPSAFAFQNSSSLSKTYTLNLGGNFAVTGTGSFVGGSSSSPANINFSGGAASVTFNAAPGVMAVTSPVDVKNNFTVASGKTLTLLTNILPASTSTNNNWNFTVNTGGTLVCGTNEIGTNAATARTSFTLQSGATLRTAHVGGVWNTTTGTASITTTAALATFSSGANYEFNGASAQATSAFATTPTASTVANMIINNTSAGGVTLSSSYTVSAALQMQSGRLTLGTFNLIAASITGAPFSNTKMVITNGTGALGQPVSVATILFPVGNGTNYTPASYTFTVNSTARNLFVRAVTPRNVNDLTATNYIGNRWWNTDLSVTTGSYTYTASYTYISGDLVGSDASIRLNRWNGSAWVEDPSSSVNTSTLTLNSGTLTQASGPLAATAEWVGRVYTAPAVYHWINPLGGSWLVASNWSPAGVPASGDGVVFDVAGGATYPTTNMPVSISLTQFTVSANNIVTFTASNAGTLGVLFPGTATPQFSVASGSAMTIAGSNVVTFSLPAGATGNVAGSLNLQGAAHRVSVTSASALTFPAGGYFSYGVSGGSSFTGNPFGTTGTTPVVVFQNGSVCECFEGSNPFGSTAADRLVAFNGGSLFRYSDIGVATLPSASGRTYANFTYNANKVCNMAAAANTFLCDSLTVTTGTLNFNLQGTPTPDHAIKGNINVLTGATLSFTPSASGTVNMNSGGTQIIWGAGTLNINNSATFDINAGTTASLQKNVGVTGTGTLQINGTLVCTGENNISSSGTVSLNNGGTLSIQSVNGISNTGVGNIRTTTFTYNNGGNFTYSGTTNQITGNRLPVTLSGTPLSTLTIANTGTVPNNIVTLTTNNTQTARLNLNAGQFNAGTGGTLIIGGGTNLVVGGGGNQFLAGSANDNIIRFSSNGAVQNTPELWNVTIAASGSGVDFTNNARINGILLINTGGFVNPNAPRYNTGSFLIYNTGGAYNRALEWSNNAGTGAAGYPHHVTIQNGTTLDILSPAFDLGCGGDLTVGTASPGTLSLSNYTQPYDLFVKGNINIGSTAAGALLLSNSVGSDLYLTGNWTRNANGTVNFGAGNGRSVYFEGSTDATITASGGQYFPYVRMQKAAKTNKVTLADHVSIGFEVTFTRGTLDLGTNNKFFSLLSNANYDARVDVSDSLNMAFVYGSDDVNGQFIVQRYFPAKRAWRLVNAPLKPGGGTHSISQAWQEQGNGANGFDFTAANVAASIAADTSGGASGGFATHITGNTSTSTGFDLSPNNQSSIKSFSAGTWVTPPNTNATGVNSKEGWLLFVRGDRTTYGEINHQYKTPTVTTLRPRGQIFLGQKTITASGMQTVGNPYASAVDYFTMTRAGTGWPANPTYYVWDPYLGGTQGVGAWVTLSWNGTDFTRSSPYGPGTYDSRYIPSGAAIMVDFPAGGGTLSMNEANKNTDSNTTAFRPVRQLMTVLQTKDADNSMYVADGALSLFGDNFNNDFDVDDARKLSNINENICLRRANGYLSIERKKLNAAADTIFYFTSKLQRKNYQLKFVMNDIDAPAATTAFLEDLYLKTKTPVSMSGTTEIEFAVTNDAGSAAAERFRLVFRPAVRYTNINADMLNSDVAVNWSVSDEWNIEKYEIERSESGANFTSIVTKAALGNSDVPVTYSGVDVSPAPGVYYYRIKTTSRNGVVAYSDVVKIKVVKATAGLYVFPNPVVSNTIQLQFNKAAEGTYSVVLYGHNGQVIKNTRIVHAGGTATKIVEPGQELASGTYELLVTSPGGEQQTIKVLVAK